MAENNNSSNNCCVCGCVGYAFVPIQEFSEIYDTSKALNEGTVFPELNLTVNEYGSVCFKTGGLT